MCLSLEDDRSGKLLAYPTHRFESEQNLLGRDRLAPRGAAIDRHSQNLQAATPSVADQDVRRVEPHWLVVEQRRVVLSAKVMPQPGRLVRQHGERVRVAFGEPEFRKRAQLFEHVIGVAPTDSLARRAIDEAGAEALHCLSRPPPTHRASELIGLAW